MRLSVVFCIVLEDDGLPLLGRVELVGQGAGRNIPVEDSVFSQIPRRSGSLVIVAKLDVHLDSRKLDGVWAVCGDVGADDVCLGLVVEEGEGREGGAEELLSPPQNGLFVDQRRTPRPRGVLVDLLLLLLERLFVRTELLHNRKHPLVRRREPLVSSLVVEHTEHVAHTRDLKLGRHHLVQPQERRRRRHRKLLRRPVRKVHSHSRVVAHPPSRCETGVGVVVPWRWGGWVRVRERERGEKKTVFVLELEIGFGFGFGFGVGVGVGDGDGGGSEVDGVEIDGVEMMDGCWMKVRWLESQVVGKSDGWKVRWKGGGESGEIGVRRE